MRKAVGLWSAPLLMGAIAALLGCGDATLVGVGSPPPPPEAQRVGSPVSFALLGCTPVPNHADTRTLGSKGGASSLDPNQLGGPSGELPGRAKVSAAAPSDTVNRIPLRPEAPGLPKPAPLGTSYQNCSLHGRSNYAVAW